MNPAEREDMCLVLLRDANEEQSMWIDRWEVSYPLVKSLAVSEQAGFEAWQQSLQDAFEQVAEHPLFVVAHAKGCAAFCAWLYHCDVMVQKRIKGVMLVAPIFQDWQDDSRAILSRARCNFPTAVVVGEDDAACSLAQAKQIAEQLGARMIPTPVTGRLNQPLAGWQWGMKLMQEMILA